MTEVDQKREQVPLSEERENLSKFLKPAADHGLISVYRFAMFISPSCHPETTATIEANSRASKGTINMDNTVINVDALRIMNMFHLHEGMVINYGLPRVKNTSLRLWKIVELFYVCGKASCHKFS